MGRVCSSWRREPLLSAVGNTFDGNGSYLLPMLKLRNLKDIDEQLAFLMTMTHDSSCLLNLHEDAMCWHFSQWLIS